MNSELFEFAVQAGAAFLAVLVISKLARRAVIEVPEQHVALVTRFGKLAATIDRPGLHVWPSRLFPWVKVELVSVARDFRKMENIHVNDARGTTVLIDLWVEVRVVDPARALFAVDDWNRTLGNLVVHAATSELGTREFSQILRDRSELGAIVQRDVSSETERWGVRVESAFLKNISLMPEVSHQLFGAVAARLEHARGIIDELGRLEVARLEAETSQQVAKLVADAKAQYPLAIGQAYSQLNQQPAVRRAYDSLFDLAQLRPMRTVAFKGFAEGEMRGIEAAMLSQSPTTQAD